MTRIMVLAGACVSLASALLGRNMPAIAVVGLAAIGVLAVVDIAAGVLSARPQTARDDEELRWDDALRAHAVTMMYQAPALMVFLPITVAGPDLAGLVPPGSWAAPVAGLAVSASLFSYSAWLFVLAFRRPGRRAVRLLWPANGAA
ncbi:hypothetical protein [Agromyces archimandritae]|uniref:Uncharacterized protein n=1 Tax=Agromyces archimandritae TaxID=2781962 RepID=A0A975IMI2_9MICO|nr:hypothetical protein [Agromyces archimandritae]QTX03470.1 hypothetical protein G127AT_08860 [Agromyces archimandritae]